MGLPFRRLRDKQEFSSGTPASEINVRSVRLGQRVRATNGDLQGAVNDASEYFTGPQGELKPPGFDAHLLS